MKYSLFNKIKTNLTFDKGSVRMQIDYVKDDLLKTIAERFGIDYIKFKHFLMDTEKDSITEKLKSRLTASDFKNLIVFSSVTYSNSGIVIVSKDRTYTFFMLKKKLILNIR